MNISEFERTKPVEAMKALKALNALIKKVDETLSSEKVTNIFWLESQLEIIKKDLEDIREKLNGVRVE